MARAAGNVVQARRSQREGAVQPRTLMLSQLQVLLLARVLLPSQGPFALPGSFRPRQDPWALLIPTRASHRLAHMSRLAWSIPGLATNASHCAIPSSLDVVPAVRPRTLLRPLLQPLPHAPQIYWVHCPTTFSMHRYHL